jgi:hypothetical protein
LVTPASLVPSHNAAGACCNQCRKSSLSEPLGTVGTGTCVAFENCADCAPSKELQMNRPQDKQPGQKREQQAQAGQDSKQRGRKQQQDQGRGDPAGMPHTKRPDEDMANQQSRRPEAGQRPDEEREIERDSDQPGGSAQRGGTDDSR